MADAAVAARERIDRALAALEKKLNTIRAGAAPVGDDDLFAPRAGDDQGAEHLSRFQPDIRAEERIAELEAAGRDASVALARAAEGLRALMAAPDEAAGD